MNATNDAVQPSHVRKDSEGQGAKLGQQSQLGLPSLQFTQGVTKAPAFVARKIWIYRNGDSYFSGRKIVITQRNFKNFEQVTIILPSSKLCHVSPS
jgi:hypothetical protein